MPYVKVGEENSGHVKLHYEDYGAGEPITSSRLPVERPGVGQAGAGVARRRPSCHHLRPPRVRQLESAIYRLRLRHLRDGSGAADRRARPARGDARRALDGNRRGDQIHRQVRLRPRRERQCSSRRSRRSCSQTDDNPEGLPASLFEGFVESAKADTPAWMKGFLDNFYNMDQYSGKLVSPRRSKQPRPRSRPRRSRQWRASRPGKPTSVAICRRSTCRSS